MVSYSKSFSGGELTLPPSKSAAHRALICAALSGGDAAVNNMVLSRDVEATLNALSALGVLSEYDGVPGRVRLSPSLKPPEKREIDCLESGSTLRFVIPVCAAIGGEYRFVGRGRLPERPLGVYRELLPKHGVSFRSEGERELPLNISGRLVPGEYRLPGNVSSQFISGLLMALPMLSKDSDIVLTSALESEGYVKLTVSVLNDFGIRIDKTPRGWHVPGGQKYIARDYTVEGDWSQAAFFLCMAALSENGARVRLKGLDPDSAQGDMACLEKFREFGLEIKFEDGMLTAFNPGFSKPHGGLKGITADVSQIPDMVPALAVCGAFAGGETGIVNAARLRLKESDRLSAMENAINAIGGRAYSTADSLIIEGVDGFKGGRVLGQNDHRVVMAMAAAALRCTESLFVTDEKSIEKSYPGFFDDFIKLGGKADVIDMG